MHLGKVIHLLICMTDGIVKIRLMQTATGFRVANYNPMGNNAQETDRNTVDGSYLRLKSLEVGYTLPQRWASHVGLQNLRVYVNAYNIFTFCDSYLKKDLKLDPEKTAGQDNRMMNYPLSSSINFGVNVSF